MSSRQSTRREKRRQARQRKQVRNILILTGVSLIIGALLILPSLRPIDDIVEVASKSHPVPVEGLSIGFPDAPVVIEVFEDFQCPACQTFTEEIEPLVLSNYVYTGQARLIFRQNPFIGQESLDAAHASMCANEQGRFWDYHDTLFANQVGENTQAFSNRRLLAMAEIIGLDIVSFESCLDAKTYETAINSDRSLGAEYQIPGTPSIVVNGQLLDTFAYPAIQIAVEQALLAAP